MCIFIDFRIVDMRTSKHLSKYRLNYTQPRNLLIFNIFNNFMEEN